jgi:hypothetical protein
VLAEQNVTATTTVTSPDGYYWGEVALVATVFEYQPYSPHDMVHFKLALYFRSHCDEIVLHPDPADIILFEIEKDSGGSNLEAQRIEIDYAQPEYNQGNGIDQPCPTTSDPDERLAWALKTIVKGISYFVPGGGTAYTMANILIGGASAFLGSPTHYQEAGPSDTLAWSSWTNPGYSFGDDNPIEQYAFNTIVWKQEQFNPTTYYGIKISARVFTVFGFLESYWIDVGPIYLQIGQNPDYQCQLEVDSTPPDTGVLIDGCWRGTTNGDPLTIISGWHDIGVYDIARVRKQRGPRKWVCYKYEFRYWTISGQGSAHFYGNPINWPIGTDGAHLTAHYELVEIIYP